MATQSNPWMRFFRFIVLFSFLLGGCGASVLSDAQDGAGSAQAQKESSRSTSFPRETSDLDKLARLWQERSKENVISDFPIGAGDVIEISVPAVEELHDRTVRVLGDGTITLPFAGRIQASGLTEDELRLSLVQQLKRYMYNPRILLFVKEYRSRQVAVLGGVVKPGLYSLSRGSDTIMDLISQAGGISPGADPRIYLIPAEPVSDGEAKQLVSALPTSLLSQDPAPLILKRTDPISIDIKGLVDGGYQQYLSLSVRPGDVIMVPGGGQILVEGWVERPGAYNVSPGLSLSGIVVAAGGPLYPADLSAVKLIRSEKEGRKSFVVTNLDKIKNGLEPDITLQAGDIVEVPSTTAKLIPWGVYSFFTTVMHVGAGIPVK